MSGSVDLPALAAAVAAHGTVTRVVIADFRGSTPRETGAAMFVWDDGQSGTIGGGTLEFEATDKARRLLGAPGPWSRQTLRFPLGPALGQCCGGQVTLLLERFTQAEIAVLEAGPAGPFMRPIASGAAPDSVAADGVVARGAARAGARGFALLQGEVMIEPFAEPALALWLYGAGHVGRAIVRVATDLPIAVTWIDTELARFPLDVPGHAATLIAADPARVVRHAPDDAVHLVMTYSHALDLGICHAVLSRQFRHLGLIGSGTKRARFTARLRDLGHGPGGIARLACPIGARALGKRPAAIALGVVTELLQMTAASAHQPVAQTS